MNNDALTNEEIATVVGLLKKLQPGAMPFAIFHQFARIAVLPIIEVVPLRQRAGKTEVLLVRREADDPIWPNALHTPGTVLRGDDQLGSFDSAFRRINHVELHGAKTTEPVYVESGFRHLGRGAEASNVYWVECLEEVPGAAFYPADSLPPELVEGQRAFIEHAVRQFEAAHQR